eukprot:TRINITY_DN2695_c0_g1_i1.p1 TRINITY_DN2695_c0_g1~~TRINITY_DN2695_c0_g1_i1.p1  ORF type:complete len:657 (+),score=133.93 TRINITY_DN2695_c0_g1_i1:66-2036(+)
MQQQQPMAANQSGGGVGGTAGGNRRRHSRNCVQLTNLVATQTTSSLYAAFRIYGEIVMVTRPDSSSGSIAFVHERDAAEMKRWEDQVQIDGLPLIVVMAESSADDLVTQAVAEPLPSVDHWKCWCCLNINKPDSTTCEGKFCDVPFGIESHHFEATLNLHHNWSDTDPGTLTKWPRSTILATEIPKEAEPSTISRVFSAYGEIKHVSVHQNLNGDNEAQISFVNEASADAAVEYEHSRHPDSHPIVAWKATSSYVVEITPYEVPWISDLANIADLEKQVADKYCSEYTSIAGIHVLPDGVCLEFPKFDSVLDFLAKEKQLTLEGITLRPSLSTKYAKWPCLSCCHVNNPVRQRTCVRCHVQKSNFKVLNLAEIWPQQLQLLRQQQEELAYHRQVNKYNNRNNNNHNNSNNNNNKNHGQQDREPHISGGSPIMPLGGGGGSTGGQQFRILNNVSHGGHSPISSQQQQQQQQQQPQLVLLEGVNMGSAVLDSSGNHVIPPPPLPPPPPPLPPPPPPPPIDDDDFPLASLNIGIGGSATDAADQPPFQVSSLTKNNEPDDQVNLDNLFEDMRGYFDSNDADNNAITDRFQSDPIVGFDLDIPTGTQATDADVIGAGRETNEASSDPWGGGGLQFAPFDTIFEKQQPQLWGLNDLIVDSQ